MSGHTPGPWIRDRHSGLNCDVRSASGRKIALCWGLSQTAIRNSDAYRAECDANAVLIAQAPDLLDQRDDLLDVCKALLAAAGSGESAQWFEAERTARATIAAVEAVR